MPHKTSNFICLKQLLAPISQTEQGIATTIGLLASSGLNHTQLMPEMCHLLQKRGSVGPGARHVDRGKPRDWFSSMIPA